jgi:hypothetical protein
MANRFSSYSQFNYQPLPLDLLLKMGQTKDEMMQENIENLQKNFDNLANIPAIYRPDIEYKTKWLNGISDELQGLAKGDLTDPATMLKINNVIRGATRDPNIMGIVRRTSNYQEYLKDIQDLKKTGKYSEANAFMTNQAMRNYNANGQLNDENSSYLSNYNEMMVDPYYDYNKETQNALKILDKEVNQTSQLTGDGYIKTIKNLSPERIYLQLDKGLTSQAKLQLYHEYVARGGDPSDSSSFNSYMGNYFKDIAMANWFNQENLKSDPTWEFNQKMAMKHQQDDIQPFAFGTLNQPNDIKSNFLKANGLLFEPKFNEDGSISDMDQEQLNKKITAAGLGDWSVSNTSVDNKKYSDFINNIKTNTNKYLSSLPPEVQEQIQKQYNLSLPKSGPLNTNFQSTDKSYYNFYMDVLNNASQGFGKQYQIPKTNGTLMASDLLSGIGKGGVNWASGNHGLNDPSGNGDDLAKQVGYKDFNELNSALKNTNTSVSIQPVGSTGKPEYSFSINGHPVTITGENFTNNHFSDINEAYSNLMKGNLFNDYSMGKGYLPNGVTGVDETGKTITIPEGQYDLLGNNFFGYNRQSGQTEVHTGMAIQVKDKDGNNRHITLNIPFQQYVEDIKLPQYYNSSQINGYRTSSSSKFDFGNTNLYEEDNTQEDNQE